MRDANGELMFTKASSVGSETDFSEFAVGSPRGTFRY